MLQDNKALLVANRNLTKADDAILLFNHIPKTGGRSMQRYFERGFGKENVLRIPSRRAMKSLGALTENDLSKFRIISGHFRFGGHRVIKKNVVYFGIIRDPIDRIISFYHYTKSKGIREDKRKYAQEVDVVEYCETMIKENGEDFGSLQARYLSGRADIKQARDVIQTNYLICCATNQINDCQDLFSQIYHFPLKRNLHVNKNESGTETSEAKQYLLDTYKTLFEPDFELLRFVEQDFAERWGPALKPAETVTPSQPKPAKRRFAGKK